MSDYDHQQLEDILGRVTDGIAQLRVGGSTESAIKHRKELAEDTVEVSQAILEEGVLPGRGAAARRCQIALRKLRGARLSDQAIGVAIKSRALRAPFKRLGEIAGADGSIVSRQVETRSTPPTTITP